MELDNCVCCGVLITPENCQYGFVFCDDCDRMLESVHKTYKAYQCSIHTAVNLVMKDKPESQKEFAEEWWTS